MAVFDHVSGAVHELNHGSALVWSCVAGATDPRDVAARATVSAPRDAFAPGDVEATVAHLARCGLLPFERDEALP